MPYGLGLSTSVYTAADLAISGRVRVFQATWLASAGADSLVLRNGAVDSATIWVTAAGTASKTVTLNLGKEGLVFDSGCFIDIGSSTSVVVTYRVEL
jgi:hypothetical protein